MKDPCRAFPDLRGGSVGSVSCDRSPTTGMRRSSRSGDHPPLPPTLPDSGDVGGIREAAAMSPTDDEIRSGWLTLRDAELFGVLARGLTDEERRHVAEAITRVNTRADQQVRRSKGRTD